MKQRSLFLGLLVFAVLSSCASLHKPTRVWNPPDYYAPEKYAEIEGIKICYLEAGEDNPQSIVFVHGWSGNALNWWDQFEYFKDRYHILVLDHPGHGKSEKPEDFDYSIPSFARVVVELMDYVGMDKAVVVGNSMGGAIATYMAIYYPERVEKLVLSDSAGVKVKSPLVGVVDLASPSAIKMLGVTSHRQYPGDNPKQKTRAEFSASYKNTPEELAYLKALEKSIKQTIAIDLTDQLKQIQAPTLIIWGDNDPTVPFKTAYVFTKHIPQSQLYVVKKGGHTPMMSKPREFNCVLEAFMEGRDLSFCHNLAEGNKQ